MTTETLSKTSLLEDDHKQARESASLPLFQDDDKEQQDDGVLKINQKYASEYQIRKQRQELAEKSDALLDDSDSSSEDEDEDGQLVTPAMDVHIFKTINALRTKDESIYDGSTRFFPQEETGSSDNSAVEKEDGSNHRKIKQKPKRYKDVIREQILEQIQEGESKQEKKQESMSKFEYDREQKELRSAFLESTQQDDKGDDDDEDWMVIKQKATPQEEDTINNNDKEADRLLQEEFKVYEETASKDNSGLVDPRGEVENGQEFLLDFLKNKKWMDQTETTHYDDDDDDSSLDQLERTDEFESKYNFRFEDAVAAAQEEKSGAHYSIVSYARGHNDTSLRRKDETRRLLRLQTKERKAAERKAKEEELRRLKNAKRQEMQNKLQQIKQVIGEGEDMDEETMMKLIQGDFDPEQFEQVMQQAYNDDYYQHQDTEWKTDANVRESLRNDTTADAVQVLDHDDGIDGDMYDNYNDEEMEDEAQGKQADDIDDQDDNFWGNAEGEEEETETERKLKQKMMDELYKLDYEDIVAGMPTRFKYRKVQPNSYGLSTQEILFARDTTLKQFVSLKKLAPYREDGEYFVTGKQRKRFREMVKHDIEEQLEQEEKHPGDSIKAAATGTENDVKDTDNDKPKKKRRRQKKRKGKSDTISKTNVANGVASMDGEPREEHKTDMGANIENQKKRSRTNKGTKNKKQVENEAFQENENSLEKETTDDRGKSRKMQDAGNFDGANRIIKDFTERKKKKRIKNKSALEGVSSSRLESYGL